MLGELPLINDLKSFDKDMDVNNEFDSNVILGEGNISF